MSYRTNFNKVLWTIKVTSGLTEELCKSGGVICGNPESGSGAVLLVAGARNSFNLHCLQHVFDVVAM